MFIKHIKIHLIYSTLIILYQNKIIPICHVCMYVRNQWFISTLRTRGNAYPFGATDPTSVFYQGVRELVEDQCDFKQSFV